MITERASWFPRSRKQGRAEPPHLLGEEQPRREILPVAVVKVARDHDEGNVLLDREIDHGHEGTPGAVTDHLVRQVDPGAQAGERAVEMDIGGVEELHQ